MTIFTDKPAIVAELRSSQLALISDSYFDASKLSNDYIYDKLLAAESELEHKLRVFIEPTVVLPDSATQSDIAALEADGKRYVIDAGYDYDPEFFTGESWGFLSTRHKPIISVESMYFVYPAPQQAVYTIPDSWIRLDRKYGHIRLVPAAQSFSAPLSAFMMQAMGGGRTIPFMIHVRYIAGIRNIRQEYPEAVSLIKRMCVLGLLKDAMIPQSGSISADGLSQSMSADIGKMSDVIEQSIESLRDTIVGIRMMVL